MLVPEQINLYIAEHPAWQRKVLVRLRQLVHATCDNVQESWRSGAPSFDQDGLPVVHFATSKTSVSLCFPKGDQLKPGKLEFEPAAGGKCVRDAKFRETDKLPESAVVDLLKKALVCNSKLADEDAKKKGHEPIGLEAVLRKDPMAWANWESFPKDTRNEYLDWVNDGRKEETRKHRIAKALELIRDGITREEEPKRLRDA